MYYIVGTLIDDTRNRELADCVKCNDPAANRYQKSLREGFVENGLGVNCYSYKTVSPKYYKEHFTSKKICSLILESIGK